MPPTQLWVAGVEVGCFYGIIALAYFLILEGTGFFNFALGGYAAFSGLFAAWLAVDKGWSLPMAVPAAVATAVAMAVVTEYLVSRPIEARTGSDELPALVGVAATLFAVEQLGGWVLGRSLLPGQPFISGLPVTWGSVIVQRQTLLLVGVTVLLFAVADVWLRVTRYGRMLRAVGDNKSSARLLGVPVGRVRLVATVLAGIVAGLAGPLFSPKAGVSFDSGLDWALAGFLAIVVGGTGWVWAPLLGGILLSLAEQFTGYWFGGSAEHYAVLVIALVFFALRPGGVFTRRVRV